MLYPGEKKYVSLSPSEILKPEQAIMEFGIVRTTNQTGEQISVNCPVYASDSREQLQDRMGFCYSIIQERLQEENKAVKWHNERHQIIRMADVTLKKNHESFEAQMKRVEKDLRQKKITAEEALEKRNLLKETLDRSIKLNELTVSHAKAELDAGETLPYPEELQELQCSQEETSSPEA